MSDDATRDGSGRLPAPPSEVLKFVLEHAPVRVFEVDTQGIFLMNDGVNPPGGSVPGSLVGVNAIKAYSGFPEGLAALRKALAGTESEVRYAQEGKTYDLILTPRYDAHGEVTSVLGMAQVVTERVRAEQEARKSEERFRRVFESNLLGLIFFRVTGEITDANDSILTTLGYTRADLEAGLLNWRNATVPGYEQADEHALQEIARSGACAPMSFRGEGVALVVDDDQGVREAASRLLEFFGFRVLQAVDGRHGTEVFRQHQSEIVVVILDMTMPEMNGEETFREIRRVRTDVPVILTSGYNEIEATRRFTAKGLAGFLQKPFTPKELTQKLALALTPGSRGSV